MNARHNFYSYIVASLLLLSATPAAMAVTIDELAGICKVMESAIVDVSVEYEWYNIPPWTAEEAKADMGIEMLEVKDGVRTFKLSAARPLSAQDSNDPNFLLFDRWLLEESSTIVTKDGNSWDNLTKESWNGKIGKYLNIGGWPRESRTGAISQRKPDNMISLSPVGFSIFCFSMLPEKLPLSTILRDYRELVRLDNTVVKVNGFNAIRADLLQEWTKQVCIRIYFSVDHGYTPVRYEYMNGPKIGHTVEINSLEQVAEGLWLPSSGLIRTADSERVDAFQTVGKIVVNQGLTDKYFDIDFPPETKVRDEIGDREYVTQE